MACAVQLVFNPIPIGNLGNRLLTDDTLKTPNDMRKIIYMNVCPIWLWLLKKRAFEAWNALVGFHNDPWSLPNECQNKYIQTYLEKR